MPQDATLGPGPVTKIILVRHGSTSLNSMGSSECIRGWLDIPLSPEGVKEAQKTAEELTKHDFDLILTSDLQRAEHTASIISEATGVPLVGSTRGLRPWDVGNLAGKKVADCHDMLVEYLTDKPNEKLGGGESFNEFKERVLDCLDGIRKQYPGKVVCLVTHHRNERLMQGWKDSGGGLPEDIKPDAFRHKGIPPAGFIRHTLAPAGAAPAEPDGDEDDAPDRASPPKKRVATTRPTKPSGPAKASATRASAKIAQNTPGDQAKVFKRPRPTKDGLVKRDPFDLKPAVPLKKGGDGLAKQDPFDLKPKVPITKTKPTWSSAIRGSILEA